MTDIERDLEEIGKSVWPDPEQVRRRVLSGNDNRRKAMRQRFVGPLRSFLGTGVVMVLIGGVSAAGIIAIHQHLVASSLAANQNGHKAGVSAGSTGSNGEFPRPVGSTAQPTSAAPGLPSASPSPSPPPPRITLTPSPGVQSPRAGGSLTLTQDSRGTYVVTLGATITVELTGGTANDDWSMPASTLNQVVRFESGFRSGRGDATATFVATAPGEVTLQASLSPKCPPMCGPPSFLWHVQITVLS